MDSHVLDAEKPAVAEAVAQAWLALTIALALHVADEALTGFLNFYNPLVLQIRARLSWFPMPTFTFPVWLAGLIAAVVVLALLALVVRHGAAWTRIAAWVFGGIMLLNGLGHLFGSLYFRQWLPGATSAPLLIAASVMLVWQTSKSARADESDAVTS